MSYTNEYEIPRIKEYLNEWDLYFDELTIDQKKALLAYGRMFKYFDECRPRADLFFKALENIKNLTINQIPKGLYEKL